MMGTYLLGLSLFMMMGATVNLQAESSVITKEYYPVEKSGTVVLTNGQQNWEYKSMGKSNIDGKQVYAVDVYITDRKGSNRSYRDKQLYSINKQGDIYQEGRMTANQKVEWNLQPYLVLKGKMEIGQKYVDNKDAYSEHAIVLKGLKTVRIGKKIYNNCLEIEDKLVFDKKKLPDTTDLKTISYYAKGKGLVKCTVKPYKYKNGKLKKVDKSAESWLVR
jgi:hypothetical protein